MEEVVLDSMVWKTGVEGAIVVVVLEGPEKSLVAVRELLEVKIVVGKRRLEAEEVVARTNQSMTSYIAMISYLGRCYGMTILRIPTSRNSGACSMYRGPTTWPLDRDLPKWCRLVRVWVLSWLGKARVCVRSWGSNL